MESRLWLTPACGGLRGAGVSSQRNGTCFSQQAVGSVCPSTFPSVQKDRLLPICFTFVLHGMLTCLQFAVRSLWLQGNREDMGGALRTQTSHRDPHSLGLGRLPGGSGDQGAPAYE